MKIKKLILENIASLRKKHVIDFEHLLEDESIFAITGPTGSGKSSILTAISLALYGSHHKALRHQDIVTLEEKHGDIQLFFNSLGNEYCASWHCQIRKKNGEYLKKPKSTSTLFKIENGEHIALDHGAEKVLDLNFDQFCKSVILNQGEFANFLISSFTDRKAILEKLYDREMLSQIGTILRADMKDLSSNIEKIEAEIKGLNSYDQGEIKQIKETLAKDQENLKSLSQHHSSYKNSEQQIDLIIQQLKRLLEQQTRSHQYRQEVTESTKILNSLKNLLNEKNESLTIIKTKEKSRSPLYRQAMQNRDLVENNTKALKEYQGFISNNQSTIEKEKINLKKSDLFSESLEQEHQQIEKQITAPLDSQQLALATTQLEKMQKAQHDILIKIATQKGGQEQIVSSQKSCRSKIPALQSAQKIISDIVQELKSLNSSDEIDTFLTERIEHQNKQKTNMTVSWSDLQRDIKEVQRKLAQKQEVSKKVKLTQEAQKTLKNEGQEISNQIEQNNEIIRANQLLSSIKICAEKSLQENECAVCHRPYDSSLLPKESDISDISSNKEEVGKLQNIYSEIQGQLSSNRERETDHTKKLQSIDNELKQKNDRIKNNSITSKTNSKMHITDLDLDRYESIYNDSIQELEEDIGLLNKQQTIYLTNNKTISSIQDYFLEEEKKRSDLQTELNRQQLELDSLSKLLSDATQEVTQLYSCYEKDLPDNFDSMVKIISQDKKLLTEINSINLKLKNAYSEIENHKKNIENKKQENLQFASKVTELTAKNQKLNKDIEEVVGKKDPSMLLQQLKDSVQKADQELGKCKKDSHEAEISQTQANSRLEHTQEQIRQIGATITTTKQKLSDDQQNRPQVAMPSSNLSFDQEMILKLSEGIDKMIKPEVDLDNNLEGATQVQALTNELLGSINERIEELKESTISKRTILEEYKRSQKKMDNLGQTRNQKNEKLDRLKNLYDVVGKDEFRNFALGLIEEQLIIFANSELNNLCDGRYELLHETSNKVQNLEFYIIDKFRGGLKRRVSTLSGGETFLVSLALALALAEMTRGRTEIDSFFIDEGFGTLDQDAIEEALNMLLAIRNRGKQIGIISHIKTLTDRIPVNIQLEKSSMGDSIINYSSDGT